MQNLNENINKQKKTSKNRNELYIYSGVPNRVKNISEIQNCPLLFICFSSLFLFLSLSLLFSSPLSGLGHRLSGARRWLVRSRSKWNVLPYFIATNHRGSG